MLENNKQGMVIFMLIFDNAFLVDAVITPERDKYTPAIAMVAAEAMERNAATKIWPVVLISACTCKRAHVKLHVPCRQIFAKNHRIEYLYPYTLSHSLCDLDHRYVEEYRVHATG